LSGNTTSATDDYATTYGTNPVSGNLLDNDVDPQGDDLTVITAGIYESKNGSGLLQGTVEILGNGSYTFTAEPGFVGTAFFPYTVEDDGSPAAQASATLYIAVSAPPVTNPDVNAGLVNTVIPGDVSTNDIVPVGTTYGPVATLTDSPVGSTPVLSVNSDGSYTFNTRSEERRV